MKSLVAEIIFDTEAVLVSNNILSASFGALDRGNESELAEYGIYANKGNLSFVDHDLSFYNLYKKYENTTTGKVMFWTVYHQTCVATLNIEKVQIKEETGIIDLDLISSLVSWQSEEISRSLFFNNDMLYYSKSLLDLVEFVQEMRGIQLNIKTNRLARTVVNCPDIAEYITIWDFMTQICQAGMCMISDDEYGVPCIFDTTPNNTSIVVNPNKILGIGEQSKSSIPNASISSIYRTKYRKKINDKETKQVYIYDNEGNAVNYNQDLLSFSVFSDVEDYETARFRYGVKPSNPTFRLDDVIVRGCKVMSSRDNSYQEVFDDIAINATIMPNTFDLDRNIIYIECDISPSKWVDVVGDPSAVVSYIRNVIISLKTTHYTDDGSYEKRYSTEEKPKYKSLTTNNFIQTKSTYVGKDLAEEILDKIKSQYSKPIKCFTMECLPGEYYNIYGGVALSKKELFRKYDTVIPYVFINGKKRPYSTDGNGNASLYKIIGIEYSYKGILRQKLYLQEQLDIVKEQFLIPDSVERLIANNGTILPWVFYGLEANKTYTVSWSMKKSVLDQLTMYKDDSGNFRYYTNNIYTISTYPVSKEIYDLLNFTVDVKADDKGRIYIGSLFTNNIITSDEEADELIGFIAKNTNHILAFEKQP